MVKMNLNFKNHEMSLTSKVSNLIWRTYRKDIRDISEAYLDPWQTAVIDFFFTKIVNCFSKKVKIMKIIMKIMKIIMMIGKIIRMIKNNASGKSFRYKKMHSLDTVQKNIFFEKKEVVLN